MTAPVLLFGGTFDPPHRAHAAVAAAAARAIGADRIVLVPAARSPHKASGPVTSPQDRLAMLEALIADWPDPAQQVGISTIEFERPPPSYFVDTLEAILPRYAPAPIRFLIGADQALAIDDWHDAERLLSLAEPVVVARPPVTREDLERTFREHRDGARRCAWIVEAPEIDASATKFREYRDADTLTPNVRRVIDERRLYGA